MSFSSWFILILQNPSSFCTGPKIFSIFCTHIFWDTVHLGLLTSRLRLRKSLLVLLDFYIFLALSFYLILLISLVSQCIIPTVSTKDPGLDFTAGGVDVIQLWFYIGEFLHVLKFIFSKA
jgi:hypothetical protein